MGSPFLADINSLTIVDGLLVMESFRCRDPRPEKDFSTRLVRASSDCEVGSTGCESRSFSLEILEGPVFSGLNKTQK
jgi:hypothetical protein